MAAIWTVDEISEEVKRIGKTPLPDHMVARAALVNSEAGKLTAAALDWKYHRKNGEDPEYYFQVKAMRDAAISCAAQAIRFIENL